ncbi:MAG: phosphatidylserine decarboxylase family protein [Paludibacteraceae bacterium]|nr:phosphatidylserine decarboxylase family protein [Paludibacteraceae bacterium]MBO7454892.1 phosphatidylserine decarboxylase family protein [Paludibacteraceae bacterium]
MTKTKKRKRTGLHREGRKMLLIVALVAFIVNLAAYFYFPHWILATLLALSAIILVFVVYFFRDPVRIFTIDDPNYLVAPADGKVVVIEPVMENEYFHEERLQVSIFMSPFNVHANWYPCEGTILVSEHQAGNHKAAWLPKSSTENERSLVVIETKSKAVIAVRQIAGAMARRIVTYARAGKECHRNTHLGFIKLGSRVDLYLPLDTDMFVEMGDNVRGNQTIIAKL